MSWEEKGRCLRHARGKAAVERKRKAGCATTPRVLRRAGAERRAGLFLGELHVLVVPGAADRRPRTGKAVWTYKVAKGVKGVFLVSSEPPVIGVGAGGPGGVTDLLSLDGKGKYRATVRLEGGHYEVKCDFLHDRPLLSVVVGRDQVFEMRAASRTKGVNETNNWVVGFSLATGKSGMKFDAGADQVLFPLRMSGDRLLAYKTSSDGYAPSSLVSPRPGDRETAHLFLLQRRRRERRTDVRRRSQRRPRRGRETLLRGARDHGRRREGQPAPGHVGVRRRAGRLSRRTCSQQ